MKPKSTASHHKLLRNNTKNTHSPPITLITFYIIADNLTALQIYRDFKKYSSIGQNESETVRVVCSVLHGKDEVMSRSRYEICGEGNVFFGNTKVC